MIITLIILITSFSCYFGWYRVGGYCEEILEDEDQNDEDDDNNNNNNNRHKNKNHSQKEKSLEKTIATFIEECGLLFAL